MEKIKFGIQLTALMLSFPVWFMFEMKDADLAMKKNRYNNEVTLPVKNQEAGLKKETAVSGLTVLPGSKLIETNI